MLIGITKKLYNKQESVRKARYFPTFRLYGIHKTQVNVYA